MKAKLTYILVLIFNFMIVHHSIGQDKNEKYVAIELNNILCGYSVINEYDSIVNDKECLVLQQNSYFDFHLLGKEISQHQKFLYYIDKKTGDFIYYDNYLRQGDVEMGWTSYVEGNRVRFVELNGKEKIIDIPDGAIMPNTRLYPYLIKEKDSIWTKELQVYNVSNGHIEIMEYSKIGEEEIAFAGEDYSAIIVVETDPVSGMTNKLWINKENGIRLKIETSQKLVMYLTDSSVPNRLSTGNLDENLFMRTNVLIEDIRAISFMKVRVIMTTFPSLVMKDINITGQKYSGSIDGNDLDGVFTISHPIYNGSNSPPFPYSLREYKIDSIYLLDEDDIESDDPDLILLAKKITDGAENSWEAAVKISQWVANNIDGSILDGSAKETFEAESGLCGAQSRLMVALCRSIGIPSRVVWGLLYTKEYDGSFGVHGWCEVFMGNAGWIPLDVTLHEVDYIDSGHIRFGILNTPKVTVQGDIIEILKYN